MKIWEKVIERKFQKTILGEEQFGFMLGRGTMDVIFTLRQVMEKRREKRKELHMLFIDSGNPYDQVPQEEV